MSANGQIGRSDRMAAFRSADWPTLQVGRFERLASCGSSRAADPTGCHVGQIGRLADWQIREIG
eukprot:12371088-Prorocentrum_lima.AAC.1